MNFKKEWDDACLEKKKQQQTNKPKNPQQSEAADNDIGRVPVIIMCYMLK